MGWLSPDCPERGVAPAPLGAYGTDYTTCLDRIRIAVAALPVSGAVLDGGAVAFDAEGRADFGALRGRAGQAHAIVIAYDLLELDGRDLRREPLQERTRISSALMANDAEATEHWRENMLNAWAALRMVRDTIETLGPPGALVSRDAVLMLYGPEPVHEGQAIVDALTQLLSGREGVKS